MDDIIDKKLDQHLIFLRSADKRPRSIVYDKGFKLPGTPLAFNGSQNPGLLFFSDLNMKVKAGTRRIIGSDIAVATLGNRLQRIDAIAVSYERLFKLGKMDLRLLPSGMGPGAAMLEITFKEKKILYTSGIRTTAPLLGPAAHRGQWDIMVLDFVPALSRPPAPRTMKPRLLDAIKALADTARVAPAVTYDSATTLFDVVGALSDSEYPLWAHRQSYALLREVAICAGKKLAVKRLNRRWPVDGVVIVPNDAFFKSEFATNSQISTCHCERETEMPPRGEHFRFGEPEHVSGLIQFARSSGVQTVFLSPGAGENSAIAFQKAGFSVYFSRTPRQLKLPL